mmetsp:Transcript_16465/g.45119  ORF Transcript_16465/g.45119 Transcript_16465/m.45119 type:complete len:93 (-) Transcript_16465:1385-1663(-)|eukprot:1161323-Pelagomonas_calceolata.AAC.6
MDADGREAAWVTRGCSRPAGAAAAVAGADRNGAGRLEVGCAVDVVGGEEVGWLGPTGGSGVADGFPWEAGTPHGGWQRAAHADERGDPFCMV